MNKEGWKITVEINEEHVWSEEKYELYDPMTKKSIDWLLDIAKEVEKERDKAMNQKKDVKLNKDDWNKLDELLSKHGFAGYYDLVECLKIVARRVLKDKLNRLPDWESKAKDLPGIVNLLLALTFEDLLVKGR